ncbi:MAG TPA: hypothetical protein VFL72_07075 [Acidimicrobiia bacterium]|nr:hypothetical protein [Acidimicrobiia bacterium]
MLRIVAIVLLAAVDVGGGFGGASAEVLSLSEESMEIEIQVEVPSESDAVVVHLVLANEDPVTLPLVSRGDGVLGITTELKPANYQVVFETLGDPSIQSLPMTLTDLGADIDESLAVTTTTEGGLSSVTRGWGWLALAFGAASLAALAFWALGGPKDEEVVTSEPGPDVIRVEDDPEIDDQASTDSTPDP